MTGVLQCENLGVRYDGNVALSGVNFGIPAGQMVGLVGANGAGKSTLVNALAGWSRGRAIVTGRISLEGQGIEALAAHQRVQRGLTLVPEGKNIFAELTVDENLALVRPPPDTAGRHIFRSPTYSISSRVWPSGATTRARRCPAANGRCWRSGGHCSRARAC